MFKIIKSDKKTSARLGILKTSHGDIKTPAFMPVGTLGTVKTTTPDELNELGADIILGNTYHLYLRPGDQEIKKLGGLHKFMRWDKPILTDSGGFQVFSLGKSIRPISPISPIPLVKITPDGVWFRSHLDGSKHFFTPEKVINIQRNLGSDIMMILDECTPFPATKKYATEAMNRTHDWALKSLKAFQSIRHIDPIRLISPLLFGIIQGSTFKNLREQSAKYISSLPFDGIAIGGVSVGEGKKEMYRVLDWVMPIINKSQITNHKLQTNSKSQIQNSKHLGFGAWDLGFNKPRAVYLMGVGTPEDILEAVERGVDMFDCVLPTRLARHGAVWVKEKKFSGKLNLLNSSNKSYPDPIMSDCSCYACRNGFSRAYIHHLLKENEVLGIRLTTLHNLHFILDLMSQIRDNISKGTFLQFKKAFLKNWKI